MENNGFKNKIVLFYVNRLIPSFKFVFFISYFTLIFFVKAIRSDQPDLDIIIK